MAEWLGGMATQRELRPMPADHEERGQLAGLREPGRGEARHRAGIDHQIMLAQLLDLLGEATEVALEPFRDGRS